MIDRFVELQMKFKNWKPFLKFLARHCFILLGSDYFTHLLPFTFFSLSFPCCRQPKNTCYFCNRHSPLPRPHSPCDLATICKPVGSSSPFLLSYLPLSHLPAFFTFFPRVHVFAFCFCICAEIKLHRRTIQLE